MLCVPVRNKRNAIIGVVQSLIKKTGIINNDEITLIIMKMVDM